MNTNSEELKEAFRGWLHHPSVFRNECTLISVLFVSIRVHSWFKELFRLR